MFKEVMNIGSKLSKEVIRTNLRTLSELKLTEIQINKIAEIVTREGSLDANDKLTPEGQQEIQKIERRVVTSRACILIPIPS